MDKLESISILRQLADGIDPSTGERLSAQRTSAFDEDIMYGKV